MSYGTRSWKVEYTNLFGESIFLDNVIDVRLTKTLKAKTNSLELVLHNRNNRCFSNGELIYKADDIIKVYAAIGDVDTTNPAHFLGIFLIIDINFNPDENYIKIKCIDKTYNMLARLYTNDIEKPINEIIENIVQVTNEDGNDPAPITTYIDNEKSNGSPFPTKRYTCFNKTAYEAITELSQINYTEDDMEYIFWFDENNNFYWKYPGKDIPLTTIKYNSLDVISMKINKTESQTISMVIYNAGEDLNGNAWFGYYLDPLATSIKNRMLYQPMTDISRDLKATLTKTGEISTISNEQFTNLLEEKAQSRAKAIVSKVGQGLWKCNVTIRGEKISPGGIITIDLTDKSGMRLDLRVTRIVHQMNRNGWTTLLTLEEDPEKIQF